MKTAIKIFKLAEFDFPGALFECVEVNKKFEVRRDT
jgi:hypothetical protein